MKKPTAIPQDAVCVIVQTVWLCNSALVQNPQRQPTLSQPRSHFVNLFKPFEEDFAHFKFTLSELAKRCNMSPSAFKRKFAEHYGLPPHRWQIKQRLNRAAVILFSTDLLVKQIAYESGFATPSHFIRCFKKEFGCTPEEYRKQLYEK